MHHSFDESFREARMTMEPAGTGRMVLSLVVLGCLGLAVWLTMEPGKYQQLTWLLLGFFALRVVLGWVRSRRMDARASARGGKRVDEQEG